MIEVVTKGVTVNTGNAIPLQTITFVKGCSVKKSGTDSLVFRTSGVYLVNVDAYVSSSTATTGTVGIQLANNGNLIGIESIETVGDATSKHTLTLNALVYVPSTCCCEDTTTITVQNTGNSAVVDLNVVVTKVC